MREQLMKVVVLLFLTGNTWTDLRRREIAIASVPALGIAGVLNGILNYKETGWMFLLGLIPGSIMLIFAILTKEKIGMGDGLASMAAGLALGLGAFMEVLTIAMGLAFLWAAGLFLWKKQKKEVSFPFLPFLLSGYLGGLWIWNG